MTSGMFRVGMLDGMAHYMDCGELKPSVGWMNHAIDAMGIVAFTRLGIPKPSETLSPLDLAGQIARSGPMIEKIMKEYERGCDAGVRIASRMNVVDVKDNSAAAAEGVSGSPLKEIGVWVTEETLAGMPLEKLGLPLREAFRHIYPGTIFEIQIGSKDCISFVTQEGRPANFNPEETFPDGGERINPMSCALAVWISNHVEKIVRDCLEKASKAHATPKVPKRG